MTVIAAAVTKQGVVIAADRETTAGWVKYHNDFPKLWTTGQFAFGAAGCVRTSQVVRHHVEWPTFRSDEDTDLEAFLVKRVVPAIRSGVADRGVVENRGGVESIGSTILLAFGKRLAVVHGNGAIGVDLTGRVAIGSGYAEALGRLGDVGPWTEDDVVDAVRRARISAVGCGGPISVVNTADLTVREVAS